MSAVLDLNLLPIARLGGREVPDLLGLFFMEPPRRTARGREQDRLVLYLVFEGNASLPPDQRDKALSDLAKLYYKTPGSVTAGLRKTADELNAILLERNRALGASRQGVAHLAQVVLREGRLTIAQSGPLHVYLISADGAASFNSPETSGPGLGISRNAALSFAQADLKSNDTLLLSATPAPEWSLGLLSSFHGQGPESLRRKLFQQTSMDLNAVALQARQGKGKFILLRPTGPTAEKPSRRQEETGPRPAPALQTEPASAFKPDAESNIVAAVPSADSSIDQLPVAPAPVLKVPEEGVLPRETQPADVRNPVPPESKKRPFSGFRIWIGRSWLKLKSGLKTLLERILPDELILSIPSSVMALIALAVPVVIVSAASVVYFRLGRTAQFELLSSQAGQAASQAMEQSDLGVKRSALGTAYTLLKKAETFTASPEELAEVQSLQAQVRTELDGLDFVRRVNYVSAIAGGLPVATHIIQMAAFDDELYMLDNESGGVVRAALTDQGYEIDHSFQCSPGNYGEITINKIVEILAWPAGYEPSAKLLGIDPSGNVLFCQPNQIPIAQKLEKPAEGEGWGDILEASLDQGDFYALDLPSNGVWIYWRGIFTEQPTLFFDEEIPPLKEVIDMLVDRDDLYLLQSNGSMMLCVRNTLVVAPTRCAIQPYIDRRPGRENMPVVPPTPFTQMLSTPPPDPSLFLLEPKTQAFFHFSLRNLAFQKEYLPENPLPDRDATAFAINTTRHYLYLALGNQIFYAAMP